MIASLSALLHVEFSSFGIAGFDVDGLSVRVGGWCGRDGAGEKRDGGE